MLLIIVFSQNRDEGDFSDKEKDEENNDDGNIEDLPARETEAASLQECLKNLLLYILHVRDNFILGFICIWLFGSVFNVDLEVLME